MSLNRTLVAGASSVVVALGTQAPKIFADKSQVCLEAIANQASDRVISLACGNDFGNGDLILMLVLGGAAFLVINFWKDILQYFSEREREKS